MNRGRPFLVVGVALALFAAIFFFRESVSGGPSATTPEAGNPTTSTPNGPDTTTTTVPDTPNQQTRTGYLTSVEGAMLLSAPGQSGIAIAGGITFPILGPSDGGFRVMDTCGRDGWLASSDVIEGQVPTDRGDAWSDSVFVIDPGHGYPDLGALGPTRLHEADMNLDVSARLAELLRAPHDIDWATGAVTSGSSYQAVASVILTRSPDGPNQGDYEMPLTFRSLIANSAEATALISIHHNATPSRSLDHPGSEAYVQIENAESARLGGLIVDELRRGLGAFDADWMGGPGDGLRSRLGSNGGDYYTVLDEAEGTAVIVEGAYISNASEEALIRTEEFRQAYADSVYRALVRWVTTDDAPLPAPEPEPYSGPGGPGRDWDNCVVPPAG